MSQKECEIAKKTVIRDFLTIYNIPGEKEKAKHFFFKECKNLEWSNKKHLVLLFFDFCYDSSSGADAKILSLLLIYLFNTHYINEQDIRNALLDFTEFYSSCEKDITKINGYFSNICLDIISIGILDLSFINGSLLKDPQIDKKNKKNQIFGRRADILAQILKQDNTLKAKIEEFLINDSTLNDFKAYYGLF